MRFAADAGSSWRRFDLWLLRHHPRLWVGRLPVLLALAALLWGSVLAVVYLTHSYAHQGRLFLSYAGADLYSTWVLFLFLGMIGAIYWIVRVQLGARGLGVGGWQAEPRARMMLVGFLLLLLPAPAMSYFVSRAYSEGRCQLFDYGEPCSGLGIDQQLDRIRQDYDAVSGYHKLIKFALEERSAWADLPLLRSTEDGWITEFEGGPDAFEELAKDREAFLKRLLDSRYAASLAALELLGQAGPGWNYEKVFVKGVSFKDDEDAWQGLRRKLLAEPFLETAKIPGTDLYRLDTLGLELAGLLSAFHALRSGLDAGARMEKRLSDLAERYAGSEATSLLMRDYEPNASRSPEFKEQAERLRALATKVISISGADLPDQAGAVVFEEGDATALREWRQKFYDSWVGLTDDRKREILKGVREALQAHSLQGEDSWQQRSTAYSILSNADAEVEFVKNSLRELVGAIAAQNPGLLSSKETAASVDVSEVFKVFEISESAPLAPHAMYEVNIIFLLLTCLAVAAWMLSRHHGFGITLLLLVLTYFAIGLQSFGLGVGIGINLPGLSVLSGPAAMLSLMLVALAGLAWRCRRTRRCSRRVQLALSFLILTLPVSLFAFLVELTRAFSFELAPIVSNSVLEAGIVAAAVGYFPLCVLLLDPIWSQMRRVHALPS